MLMNDDTNWTPISLSNIFTNYHGKRLVQQHRIPGPIPLLTAGKTNNGIAGFVSNDMQKYRNFVSVDMFDNSFVHPYWATGDDNIYFLTNPKLSEDVLSYISTCIQMQSDKFSYGKQFRQRNADITQIMLPTTETGEIDYAYMEKFVREKRKTLNQKYNTYAEKRIADLGECSEIPKPTQKNWAAFLISDIFDIRPGRRLVASDSTPGNRPFIGALDNSNGVARFVNDINVSLDKNVLGVNYNGNGMVIGFYHPYECIFSDDVKRFHLKHHEDNVFVLLFMKVVILQQKSKFGYLYKFNAERMANTRIMLPVTDDGAPDYEYMELYVKKLMIRKYKQYLSYMDSKEESNKRDTTD